MVKFFVDERIDRRATEEDGIDRRVINERNPDVHEIMAQRCVRLDVVHCK